MIRTVGIAFLDPFLLFVLFALYHSIGAQEWFKTLLAKITSQFFIDYFYRVFYCGISLVLLTLFFYPSLYSKNVSGNILLMQLPIWVKIFFHLIRLLGLVIVYQAFIQFNYFEFLGISQAIQGIQVLYYRIRKKQILIKPMSTIPEQFDCRGIYRFIRHPMLIGGFLFCAFAPFTINSITHTFLYTVYMLIGGHYEEKRLIKNLGQKYLDYQTQVGAFFPKLNFYRYPSDGRHV